MMLYTSLCSRGKSSKLGRTPYTERRSLGFSGHYVAIACVLFGSSLGDLGGLLSGEGLPPLDGHLHVLRLPFHGVADPA